MPAGNGIGGRIPEGYLTREQAAREVGRDASRLKEWHRRYEAGDKTYIKAAPRHHVDFGKLRVWLYSKDDMRRLKEFVATQPKNRKRTKA